MIDAPQATRPSRLLGVAHPFLSPPTHSNARSRGPHRREVLTFNRSSGSIMLRFVQPPRAPGVTLPLQAHQMTKIDRACREVRLSFLEVPHSTLTKAEERSAWPAGEVLRESPQAVSELPESPRWAQLRRNTTKVMALWLLFAQSLADQLDRGRTPVAASRWRLKAVYAAVVADRTPYIQ